ncbi:MAG: hypothetical protein ABIW81_01245 [Terrimesophilobacter sp.]
MRWNNLFDDLESQLEHEIGAEDVDLKGEEERLRLGRLTLRDRLMSIHAAGAEESIPVRLSLCDGTPLRVAPLAFGKDWMSATVLDESRRRAQVVVPLWAIGSITLDRGQIEASLVAPEPEQSRGLAVRLSLAFVLRDLCRRRRATELLLIGGVLRGTIDRVGRDHCDLAVHESGVARRDADVVNYRVVPFSQLLLVRM